MSLKLGSCLPFLPVVVHQEAVSLDSWSLCLVPCAWCQGFAMFTRSYRLARNGLANPLHSPGPGTRQRSPQPCWHVLGPHSPALLRGHTKLKGEKAMAKPHGPHGSWHWCLLQCTAAALCSPPVLWSGPTTLPRAAKVASTNPAQPWLHGLGRSSCRQCRGGLLPEAFIASCLLWYPKVPLSCSMWWHRAGH